MMIDIIDEVAWELKRISQTIKETECVPKFLAKDIEEQGAKLQEVYNEFCRMEEEQ